jgi:hypothetical protein
MQWRVIWQGHKIKLKLSEMWSRALLKSLSVFWRILLPPSLTDSNFILNIYTPEIILWCGIWEICCPYVYHVCWTSVASPEQIWTLALNFAYTQQAGAVFPTGLYFINNHIWVHKLTSGVQEVPGAFLCPAFAIPGHRGNEPCFVHTNSITLIVRPSVPHPLLHSLYS